MLIQLTIRIGFELMQAQVISLSDQSYFAR